MENNVKIQLKQINNVSNPLSIHGIYPYRGKISSIDAKNIIKYKSTYSINIIIKKTGGR